MNNSIIPVYLIDKYQAYTTEVKQAVKQKHLVVFFVIIIFIQISSDYISRFFPNLEVFQPVFISGLFSIILGVESYYEYIVGGIISSTIAYTMVRIFIKKINNHLYTILLRTVTAVIIIITMVLCNAFSPSSLSYSFQALKLYPIMNLGYIYSYVSGLIMSAVLIFLYLQIIGRIDKTPSFL